MPKAELMEKIREDVLRMENSLLSSFRKEKGWLPVVGEGSLSARVMLIGEAPGKNEAEQGRPFCGAAGRVLDNLLDVAGLKRKKVYITNIVKDRPPENRDPSNEEILAYAPFLDEQINIIRPMIIIGLGRFSAEYIMNKFGIGEKFTAIGKIHGEAFCAKAEYGVVKIVPMYHPAAALYNPVNKQRLEKDFKKIKDIL